ncbi:cyclodeaminase/cyclohydrolase family protein [Clostridium neuense]|uniref:Cyclodeaminase/cyclohydrolase family protein n=1 Tax=Clostridium neuense TaxID=1728934 RepID=A0ABW8THR9_9CLOT
MMGNLTIEQFLTALASEAPTPGGGGAAALISAISAALNSMVFNLTVGKKVYESYPDEIKGLIKENLEASKKLIEFFTLYMDKDAEAFSQLMNSYKLPKENESEKNERKAAIENCTKEAAEVPMTVAENVYKLYPIIWTACKYGNRNLISDAGVAAVLVQASLESCILNVKVNLNYLKDIDLKDNMSKKCSDLIVKGEEWKNKIMKFIYENI